MWGNKKHVGNMLGTDWEHIGWGGETHGEHIWEHGGQHDEKHNGDVHMRNIIIQVAFWNSKNNIEGKSWGEEEHERGRGTHGEHHGK